MTTTHPGDTQPVCEFDKGGAWCLDYSLDRSRQLSIRRYATHRWDGR
jgi:hypothetical protein